MKKLVSILVLVFAFSLTMQAQKKRKDKRPQLSIEQHTELAVKKMTLSLDLSEKQQSQIAPFIKSQVSAKHEAMAKRKEMKDNKSKPSADEIFAMKSKMLDHKIAAKKFMKNILNKEQFKKFEKISKRKMAKGKKMMKGKRGARNKRMAEDKK